MQHATGQSAVSATSFSVDRQEVNVFSLDEAVAKISQQVGVAPSFAVFTINLDHVVKLRDNADFRAAYGKARFVLPDGYPIVWLGRMAGLEVSRATGSDLILPLCREAARLGKSVFLLGSNTDTLQRAGQHLRRQVPGLAIAGSHAPPFPFDPNGPDGDATMELLRGAGADIVFVALSPPKQEIFAARCLPRVDGACFVCIGAGLDFLAGTQVRAPRLVQKLALEWLWRLALQPGRLAGRYLQSALVMPSLFFDSLRRRQNG